MRQHHRSGISRQRQLHHAADGNVCAVYIPLPYHLAAQQLAFGIQAQQIHRFPPGPVKPLQQIVAVFFHIVQNLFFRSLLHLVIAACGVDQVQKNGRMLSDPCHGFQFRRSCLHHSGIAAEPVQQHSGCGFGILLGNRVKQQQLQSMDRVEIVQSLFLKPGLHPLPVFFLRMHFFHLGLAIFGIIR